MFLETKSLWIEPKVIELDDNSEPEDDFNFIPPSPVSDEMSSALSARFVHLIQNEERCCRAITSISSLTTIKGFLLFQQINIGWS